MEIRSIVDLIVYSIIGVPFIYGISHLSGNGYGAGYLAAATQIILIVVYLYEKISEEKPHTRSDSSIKSQYYKPGNFINTAVVGVTFEGRQAIIDNLSINERVYLIREPDNPFDMNAIKVLAARNSYNRIELTREDAYSVSAATGNPIENYYMMDQVGYINRKLAAKIIHIFDEYAWGPNQFIKARITKISSGINKPKGVQIKFKLPTHDDFEEAKIKSIYSHHY